VVVKDGGIPGITALWRDVASAACREHGIALTPVNIDLAAYQLIQEPERFDVIVAPNLFGDILADLGGVLVGSRGLTYSGNFDACGRAVYQTNHGAAFDLAGRDVANPIGQTLSLAMLLRESFGLSDEARMIEAAISEAWRQGWRTADMAGAGCRAVGTREMGEIIARHVHPVDA
jgi:3-isopropylmalate dehydrogenase